MANVPAGLYRNHLGVEMDVWSLPTAFEFLSEDIGQGRTRGFFGTTYAVTEKSLADAGYVLVEVTP